MGGRFTGPEGPGYQPRLRRGRAAEAARARWRRYACHRLLSGRPSACNTVQAIRWRFDTGGRAASGTPVFSHSSCPGLRLGHGTHSTLLIEQWPSGHELRAIGPPQSPLSKGGRRGLDPRGRIQRARLVGTHMHCDRFLTGAAPKEERPRFIHGRSGWTSLRPSRACRP